MNEIIMLGINNLGQNFIYICMYEWFTVYMYTVSSSANTHQYAVTESSSVVWDAVVE